MCGLGNSPVVLLRNNLLVTMEPPSETSEALFIYAEEFKKILGIAVYSKFIEDYILIISM